MGIPVTTALRFDACEKERYLGFLRELGSGIRFEDDTWVCDKRIRYPYEYLNTVTLYFSPVPEGYRELIRYYVIIRLLGGITVRALKTDICGLAAYCTFLTEQGISELSAVNVHTAYLFRQRLDKQGYAGSTKSRIWSNVGTLHEIMRGGDGMALKNPFRKNPYLSHEKKDAKFISDFVAEQLDRVFFDGDISLETRAAYWILRLIPSRISEVLSMRFDCLKRYMGNYVLFIPTWKQNGGHKEPILRSIHIQNEGMSSYLIGLIEEQRKIVESLQEFMAEDKRGALFTYQKSLNYGRIDLTQGCFVLQWGSLSRCLKGICEHYDIRDENGSRYVFTSHQLRHNGITDRLAAGFTIEQIAEMTGHHGGAMIWNAYAHPDRKQEAMLDRQRQILSEPAGNPYILFGGRILNMDEQLEARLLKNLRAHRVRGGICCDVTNCKSDMWNCLDCARFIPDKEQLPFFAEQTSAWHEKAARFARFPLMRQNAEKNEALFQNIIDKLEGSEDE